MSNRLKALAFELGLYFYFALLGSKPAVALVLLATRLCTKAQLR